MRAISTRSAGRRQSLGEVHSKQNVCDTTLEAISNKICRGFRAMGQGRRFGRDHNSTRSVTEKRHQMRSGEQSLLKI